MKMTTAFEILPLGKGSKLRPWVRSHAVEFRLSPCLTGVSAG